MNCQYDVIDYVEKYIQVSCEYSISLRNNYTLDFPVEKKLFCVGIFSFLSSIYLQNADLYTVKHCNAFITMSRYLKIRDRVEHCVFFFSFSLIVSTQFVRALNIT